MILSMNILEALFPQHQGSVALIGGGGKTSVMRWGAQIAKQQQKNLWLTTTTKILQSSPIEAEHWHNAGTPPPSDGQWLWTGGSTAEGKKWTGPSLMALERGRIRVPEPPLPPLLIEADGSAGCPIKVPGLGEPVVPSWCTMVAVLVGLSALGKPAGPETLHRWPQAQEILSLKQDEPFTKNHLKTLLAHPEGSFRATPPEAKKILILNQSDALFGKTREAKELAEFIAKSSSFLHGILITSLATDEKIQHMITP